MMIYLVVGLRNALHFDGRSFPYDQVLMEVDAVDRGEIHEMPPIPSSLSAKVAPFYVASTEYKELQNALRRGLYHSQQG